MDFMERHNRQNFILLCLDSIFFSFSMSIFSTVTVLPQFVGNITENLFFIGLIPAIMMIGNNLTQIFASVHTVNSRNKKRLMLRACFIQRIGLVMVMLSVPILKFLPPEVCLAVFFLSFTIYAVGCGYTQPVWVSIVSISVTKKRGNFFGITNMAGSLLGLAGGYATKLILDSCGFPDNYFFIFLLGVGASLTSLIVFALLRYREPEHLISDDRLTLSGLLRDIPVTLKENAPYRKFILARVCLAIGELSTAFFVGRYMTRFGGSEGTVGTLSMLVLFSQAIFSLLWGFIGDRKGYTVILKWIALFYIIAGGIALWATDSLVFLIAFILIGANYNGIFIATTNLSIHYAQPRTVPIYIGLTCLFLVPFSGFGAMGVGLLADIFTDTSVFALSALGSAVGLFLLFKNENTEGHSLRTSKADNPEQ